MRLDTAERRLAARWYPKGSMVINHSDGLGVAYVSPMDIGNGRWQVVAYAGTAGKPTFYNAFRNREQAEKHVGEWLESLDAHKQFVRARRAERSKPHTLKVGDIITNSWGYDQTNVDCYQITRTSDNYVWLVEIASELVPDEGVGPMSGRVVPCPDKFKTASRIEIKHSASGASVCFKYGSGSKWDGRSLYCSWYA